MLSIACVALATKLEATALANWIAVFFSGLVARYRWTMIREPRDERGGDQARRQTGLGGRLLFLLLGLAAIVVHLAAPGRAAWVYQRTAVLEGDAWRLLSAHLVHLSGLHLLWNLVALAMIAALLAHAHGGLCWLAIALGSGLAATLGPLLLAPGMAPMAGLSALLHGLVAGAAGGWIARRQPSGWLLLAGLVAKLVLEQILGPEGASGRVLGGSIATVAHAWGAAGGLVLGLLVGRRARGRLAEE